MENFVIWVLHQIELNFIYNVAGIDIIRFIDSQLDRKALFMSLIVALLHELPWLSVVLKCNA